MFGTDELVDTNNRLPIGCFGHDEAFADSSGSDHIRPFQMKTNSISLGYRFSLQHG